MSYIAHRIYFSSRFILDLYNAIFECVNNSKLYILLGDFNLLDISWADLTPKSTISREFLTLTFKLNWCRTVY